MTYPAPIPQPAGKRTSNNGISANYTKRGRIATGLTFALGYVVVLWLVHLVNTFIFGGVLTNFGIHPLDFNGLLGIITSPFLHANFEHLISNSISGAIFCFLVGLSGRRRSEEHTSELQSRGHLVCRLLLEKKKTTLKHNDKSWYYTKP